MSFRGWLWFICSVDVLWCDTGNGWIVNKGVIAGSHNLKVRLLFLFLVSVFLMFIFQVNARFAGFCACLFSGEGPLLTHGNAARAARLDVFRWRSAC